MCPGQLCDKCKGGNGIAADRCKFACVLMDQLTERVNMSELSASERLKNHLHVARLLISLNIFCKATIIMDSTNLK